MDGRHYHHYHHHHHHHHGPEEDPNPEPPAPNPPVEHVRHVSGIGELIRQPTVRLFTKAVENCSLAIRENTVKLVLADRTDETQHWIKDLRYSTRVIDEEGLPSFSLVNKVTGQAIKHAIAATHHDEGDDM